MACSNSITPQGDGNPTVPTMSSVNRTFKFHYPARGRKPEISMNSKRISTNVQIPLPRKGTETLSSIPRKSSNACGSSNSITPQGDGNQPVLVKKLLRISAKFKFHYPARGRKHLLSSPNVSFLHPFKFHYPARGRKPPLSPRETSVTLVQIPLPRKGMETGNLLSLALQLTS